MSEEELAAQAAAQGQGQGGTPPPAAQPPEPPAQPVPPPAEQMPPSPPAPPQTPAEMSAPPAAQISLEQVVQALQMLAQGIDALKQDYLKTKEIVTGVVAELDKNAAETEQEDFLSELNDLGDDFKLGPEEKKLLYEDYKALAKEAGDKAPTALEYFKTYVPQMTKGATERMARLDGILATLAEKEAAESAKNKAADKFAEEQEKWDKLKEA
jgi:hypothetical protein